MINNFVINKEILNYIGKDVVIWTKKNTSISVKMLKLVKKDNKFYCEVEQHDVVLIDDILFICLKSEEQLFKKSLENYIEND